MLLDLDYSLTQLTDNNKNYDYDNKNNNIEE